MYKKLLYTILLGIFIIGCGGEPEEEVKEDDAPPPPPPPTPEQVAVKIVDDLQLNAPNPPIGTKIDPGVAGNMLGIATTQKVQLSATEDGQRALAIVSLKVDSKVRQTYNNELWSFVLVYSDIHGILNPGSNKFNAERIRSIAELKRPIVVIKGILHDAATNRTTAQLQLTFPLEGRTITESMKQGDVLHGLRFVNVIGSSQGIVFEYVETGEAFDVLTKAASR